MLKMKNIFAMTTLCLALVANTAFAAGNIQTGTDYHFNDATMSMDIYDSASVAGYKETEHLGALGGKAADDFSLANTITDMPKSAATASSGFIFFSGSPYLWDDLRTLEFSFFIDAEADDYSYICFTTSTTNNQRYLDNNAVLAVYPDGKVYSSNAQRATISTVNNRWHRVKLVIDGATGSAEVYLDDTFINTVGNMGYVEDSAGIPFTYFRFVAKGLQETESPDTRSFSFAIDDIRYYRNAAVSDPDSIHVYQDIIYSISENSGFSIEESGLRVQENTTWGELKSSLEVADGVSYKLYDSKITAAKTLTDTDTLDEGDVLVFTEEGNRKIEYLTIAGNVLADENFNNQADSLPAVVTNAEGVSAAHGYESGLYANADETDFARVGTINITTEHTGAASLNYQFDAEGISAVNSVNEAVKLPVATVQFSAAMAGDCSRLQIAGRPYYFNSEGTLVQGTTQANYLVVNRDGTVLLRNGKTVKITVNPEEWINVAITIYPSLMKYDLYVNGRLVVDKDMLSTSAMEGFTYGGMYWLRAGVVFDATETAAERTAKLALDNYKVYLGEYDPEGSVINLTSDRVKVSRTKGAIYIDGGEMEITDFASAIVYGDATPAIYTDHTFTEQVSDMVREGNVLVLSSENGLVKEYYAIAATPDFSYDDEITFTSADGVLTAKLGVRYIGAETAPGGVLMLAVYKNGALEEIRFDDTTATNGGVELTASCTLPEETTGVTAKAMFWDSLDKMVPYEISAAEWEAE